jgi:hypothetical protein
MSEDQKQETQQPASEPADRELGPDELDDVAGGGGLIIDLRPNEQNDKLGAQEY